MGDLSIGANASLYQVRAATDAAAASKTLQSGDSQSFTEALAREMALMQGGNAGTASSGEASILTGYLPTIMTSAAGQGLESQLLMLCMMMATGQADAGTLMSVMMQAVTAMQDESEKEKLRRSIMNSSYDNGILDSVDAGVFQTDTAAYPYEAWRACTPAVTNSAGQRSASSYSAVIDQFRVETNERYANNKRGTGDTYCNIFLWDVTSAMGAEIPHYVDADTGEIRAYPDVKGAQELTANRTYNWLLTHGERYGWVEVSAEQAQAHANRGAPAITSWYNSSGGAGHVQVIRPLAAGEDYDPQRGVKVAQAGSKRLNQTYANDIFSDRAMSELKYFIHM